MARHLDNDQQATSAKLERDFTGYKFFSISAKDVRYKDTRETRPAVTGLLENASPFLWNIPIVGALNLF